MRYDKGHKETTRRRILDTAAARFRRDGIEAVGVAEVMGEAGLTHGGFYSHFKSKEDLVRATLVHVTDGYRQRFHERVAVEGLEGWIRHYFRREHRDHPEKGCAGAALIAEITRHSPATRLAVAKWGQELFNCIAEQLPARVPADQRRTIAIGVFSTMLGAMQLSRVALDEASSDQIMEAGIAAALKLAGLKPRLSPALRN